MKTPMQELIELITLKENKEDGYIILKPSIGTAKIEAFLEKEKEVMVDFAYKCRNVMAADEFAITHWYDKTFNTNEK